MTPHLHTSVVEALKRASRPEAMRWLARETSRAREGVARPPASDRTEDASLTGLIGRQITAAQMGMRRDRERNAQVEWQRLIGQMSRHLHEARMREFSGT